MRKPPRLALNLLESHLPEEVREEIAGDLVEAYERGGHGGLWFWREAIAIAWTYRRSRPKPLRTRRTRPVTLFEDLRSAVRSIVRRPAFAAVVVLLLALGIGANAAMFQWVEAVLHRPLPYPDSERLVRVFQSREEHRESFSPPNFFDLKEETSVLSGVAAYWSPTLTLSGDGEPEKLLAATVSHDFFEVLGIPPVLGRGFAPEDDLPGAPLVAVLGHGLFERRFGGDRAILGRDIRLDGAPATVVGVAPPHFSFPAPGTELFVPLRLPRERAEQGSTPYRAFRILNVVGRLREDVPLEAARARAGSLFERLAADFPESNRGFDLEVVPLKEVETGPFRGPLYLLWASVLVVLLIVCANVGGLLLARSAARERDLAIRLALGASRKRLVRELLAEGFFLSLLAGALGALLGLWGIASIRALAPPGLPVPDAATADLRFFGFLLATTAAVLLAFAAAPALFGLRRSPAEALRSGGRAVAREGASARRTLVVAEMALASTLLVTAILLLKSYEALERVERGYREESVHYTRVELPISAYFDRHLRAGFFETLSEEVRALAGVESAGVSLGLPLDPKAEFYVTRSPYSVEGRPDPPRGLEPEAALHVVGPGFFETMGVDVTRGRAFDARDSGDAAGVVIVNESFAASAWPDGDPLGRRVRHHLTLLPDQMPSERRVVGIVSDFRYYALEREPEPQMYIPHAQSPWPEMHLVLSTSFPPEALDPLLRGIVRRMDDGILVSPLRPLAHVTEDVMAPPRLRARLLTGFAASAALLAAIGLYGVMSFSVARRTREVGLRLALGARRRDVIVLVVAQGLELALVGALLGLGGSLLATRWLGRLLYGVSTLDPGSYALMCGALVAIGALASYLPARRAAGVDPMITLRAE